MSTWQDNWSAIEVAGVEEVIRQVSGVMKGSRFKRDVMTTEDLIQHGREWIGTKADLVECVSGETPELGRLNHRLKMDFHNLADRAEGSAWRNRVESSDAYAERASLEGSVVTPMRISYIDVAPDGYTDDAVRTLLLAWFGAMCEGWGGGPEHGMPGLTSPVNVSLSLATCVIDIQCAWQHARLSTRQKQCLYLEALGFSHREAGTLLGVGKASVQEHAVKGVKRLCEYLAGKTSAEAA